MKSLFLKWLGVPHMLEVAFANGKRKGVEEYRETEKLRTLQINYPIGMEVMHLSGQDPIKKAKVVSYEDFGHSVKLVLQDESGKTFVTGGKVIMFNQNRWNSFQKLSWWDQHNVGTEWGPSINEEQAKNLEAGRPAWDSKGCV